MEVNLLRARARVSFDELLSTAEGLREEVDLIGFDAKVLSVSSTTRLQRVELSVLGMTCAACSGAVERALSKLEGVLEVQVGGRPLLTCVFFFSYFFKRKGVARLKDGLKDPKSSR